MGYKMVSCKERLVSSRPPMSSHLMLGTSTTVSRRDEGFTVPMADLKCSWLTAMESKISASIVSSSRSIKSIFSRMHVKAASVQSWARSAPTKPWVLEATSSSFTSVANFMFLVWIRKISNLPLSSGTPMSNSRSNRPKRRKAASMEFGRLVAAITTTCFVSLGCNGVDLINENDGWRILLCFFKGLAQIGLCFTGHFAHDLWTVDQEEKGTGLIGNGTGNQSLAAARRAVQEHTSRRLHSQCLE
eukprot:Skav233050  [mRNA]  locus=scaffold3507:64167:64972:- [translate_table: standard]